MATNKDSVGQQVPPNLQMQQPFGSNIQRANSAFQSGFSGFVSNWWGYAASFGIASLFAVGLAFNFRYKVSRADQWISKTGLFVQDVIIRKKTFVWPYQNYKFISLSPYTVNFTVTAMSNEKLEFGMPIVLTIGPKDDYTELVKYSKLTHELSHESEMQLVRGLIEGEVRALAANIRIEEIFLGRNKFKTELFDNVASHLNQFGLTIYNGNIEQLSDTKGSGYFTFLSQRIQAEAENTAKVEVAEQNKIGNIGKMEREAETRQRIARIEAQTQEIENANRQKIEISKAELSRIQAEQKFIIEKANLESLNHAKIIQMELEKDVEIKRALQQTEQYRAKEMSKTTVEAEIKQRQAQGVGNALRVDADAKLYAVERKAEGEFIALKKKAEGELVAATNNAQGALIVATKEAEGLEKKAQALNKLIAAYGNPHNYIMSRLVDEQILVKIAKENANALHGLNPKITVWSQDGKDAMQPIKNIAQNLIPTLDIVRDQTGYSFPDWLIKKHEESTDKKTNEAKESTPLVSEHKSVEESSKKN